MAIDGGGGPEGPPVRRAVVRQEESPQPKTPETKIPERDIFDDVAQWLRQNNKRLRIVVDTGRNEGFTYDEENKTAIRFRNVYIVPRGVRLSRKIDRRVAVLNAFMLKVRGDLAHDLQLGDCIQVNEATIGEDGEIQTGAIYVAKDPLVFQETMLKEGLRVFQDVQQVRGRPLGDYRLVEAMRIAFFPNHKAVQRATVLN